MNPGKAALIIMGNQLVIGGKKRATQTRINRRRVFVQFFPPPHYFNFFRQSDVTFYIYEHICINSSFHDSMKIKKN